MGELNIHLINGSIFNIIKYYILNKDNIKIKEKQEIFKNNCSLLDKVAIFIRILDKNILNILDDYINNDKQLVGLEDIINENIQRIGELERDINKILEKSNPKIDGWDLDIYIMKIPVKSIFLINQKNSTEKLKNNLEELEIFHKNLLSNYGKYNGSFNQDNLKIKSGSMFEYFELSDSLLNTTRKLISNIDDYQKYHKNQDNYNKELYNIANTTVYDIGKLCYLDNKLLEVIIDDVNKFIGNEEIKSKEN
jgi:hypothetical protein